MNRKKKRKIYGITIPYGYDIEDLIDIIEDGYDNEQPIGEEEVEISFEGETD